LKKDQIVANLIFAVIEQRDNVNAYNFVNKALTPRYSKAKENTKMASAPTTWKNDDRPAKNDTTGILIKAKPAKIQAKNKAAT
jgi:hypothetical protein